ncbi:MAG: thiamine-monophosphate kinase [Halomonas sp.]|nr:thiamine-monophosphate kinase [Halomonas sp.]
MPSETVPSDAQHSESQHSETQHSEFELIARFFTPPPPAPDAGVALGVGDDCTLLAPTAGWQLAVSVDTSLAGVHYPEDAPAEAVGHRALAVSLSDLAAMGARARWCLMALTLAEADEGWMEGFSRGFRALSRHGGCPGDLIAVTGALGGGAGGLALWQRGERDLDHPLLIRYLRPQPRLAAGEALVELASAAIDVSDGLLADLGHLLERSGVGAVIEPEALPLAEGLVDALGDAGARQAALTGGDDYELLLALSPENFDEARTRLAALGLPLTVIGRLEAEPGLRGVKEQDNGGWQHFHGRPSRGGSS